MKLYLVRHAIAAERGTQYPDDSKRPLTGRGVSKFREVVEGLELLGVRVDLVLTSPLTRALQTAEILSERLSTRPPVVETRSLAPGLPPQKAIDALSEHSGLQAIAMVGHEPGIGELAAALVGARSPLPFKKGGVCRIDFESDVRAGRGQLIWFATPKMLRK